MKRILGALLTTTTLVALAVLAITAKKGIATLPVVHAQGGCTNASVSGNYGFTLQGFDVPKAGIGNQVPFAGAGVLGFDGLGNVSFSFFTTVLGRKIAPPGTAAGTYNVNSDCTGTISGTSPEVAGETLDMVIVGGGGEVLGISTTNTQTFTLDAKKQ